MGSPVLGYWFWSKFRKERPLSHSLLIISLHFNPLVPTSAGFISLCTNRHWSTAVLSRMSATRFATETASFLWDESIQWMTVELSPQNQQRSTSNGKKNLTPVQSCMPIKAACNSSFGTVQERMCATRHFPTTKFTNTSSIHMDRT